MSDRLGEAIRQAQYSQDGYKVAADERDKLREEVRRLRALIPLAIDVGYAKREAEEAQERSDDVKQHPVYQREADGDRAHYEELLATLNRALEGNLTSQADKLCCHCGKAAGIEESCHGGRWFCRSCWQRATMEGKP